MQPALPHSSPGSSPGSLHTSPSIHASQSNIPTPSPTLIVMALFSDPCLYLNWSLSICLDLAYLPLCLHAHLIPHLIFPPSQILLPSLSLDWEEHSVHQSSPFCPSDFILPKIFLTSRPTHPHTTSLLPQPTLPISEVHMLMSHRINTNNLKYQANIFSPKSTSPIKYLYEN